MVILANAIVPFGQYFTIENLSILFLMLSCVTLIVLIVMLISAGPQVLALRRDAKRSLDNLDRTVLSVNRILRDAEEASLVDNASSTIGNINALMASVQSTVDNVRPALKTLSSTLENARGVIAEGEQLVRGLNDRLQPLADDVSGAVGKSGELMDDALATSKALRARVEDLEATQSEANQLLGRLNDVTQDVHELELAAKLKDVMHDLTLLTADMGILAENANSYLEHGKPLVRNLSDVVESARGRAGGIGDKIAAIRHGIRGFTDKPEDGEG
jgi:ABC-type transporter Mla subunit MlaD